MNIDCNNLDAAKELAEEWRPITREEYDKARVALRSNMTIGTTNLLIALSNLDEQYIKSLEKEQQMARRPQGAGAMRCEFWYSLHYGGHVLSFIKHIDLPSFPHKQMMIVDGDVELDLETREGLSHYASITFDSKSSEVIVCVSDYSHNWGKDDINRLIERFDSSGWERKFKDSKVSDIMTLIERRDNS